MLDHIKIDGFKSIRHLDLDMGPVNILIGANGAGKTNFLSFFKLVNSIYEQRLQNYTMQETPERLCFYGVKQTKYIHGCLNISGIHEYDGSYYFTLQQNSVGSMFLASEGFDSDSSVAFKGMSANESSLKDFTSPEWALLQSHLRSYRIYHFHDTSVGSPLRSMSNIADARELRTDGGNLPTYLYFLQKKHPKYFKTIEATIRSVMPYFDQFDLGPYVWDENMIRLEWNDVNDRNMHFYETDLSDGSLRFMALATLLLQPDLPEIIIIDEPELGFHPYAIDVLAGMISSASDRGCQIIVSTQSVELINNFEPKDIITVDRKDGQSVFSRLNREGLQNWIENYSLGELWTKNIINGQPTLL